MKRYLAVDPGTTTGLFMIDLEEGVFANAFPLQIREPIEAAKFIREAAQIGLDGIVMESFGIGEKTHGASRSGVHDALNLVGWINLTFDKCGWQFRTKLVKQQPAAGKTVSDDVLKSFGWHTKGKRHANDAARHMVRYMINIRHPRAMKLYVEGINDNS